MKKLFAVAALTVGLAFGVQAQTAQQGKMKTCNAEAGDKNGDDRKAFMKDCLSAKPAMTPQHAKMKDCSAKNRGKKGEEYKAAQKACLSA